MPTPKIGERPTGDGTVVRRSAWDDSAWVALGTK